MAKLKIVEHPDAALRRIAAPVTDFAPAVQTLAEDMLDLLHTVGGIGLSAPQVAVSTSIVVTNFNDYDDDGPQIFINPAIVARSRLGWVQESCLSVPGVVGNVIRATRLQIVAHTTTGEPFEKTLHGMHAVCLQHEIDHLRGILFIDRLSFLKKMQMRLTAYRQASTA